jgi:hypothetical protein
MPSTASTLLSGASLALAFSCAALADPAAFDLAGPTLEVTVTRGTTTLPAARVPSLMAGDRVWMKTDLPQGQTAHYLMVATFLRGSTNPPPKDWFQRCDTWETKCAQQGMTLTVPREAQQLLVFLAPETGGDYKTLLDAVRGRPGSFVRTSQDLNQATLDRSRLDAYLAAVRGLGDADPPKLKDAAPLLARSLAIKVDEKCLAKIAVLQAPCLMEGRESLILNDGHSASIAQELTSGPASDLAMEASNTPQLRSGYYGPFIGSIFDIARILDSFRTAQYQYIPALASASGQQLRLTLNAPPSFHNPKSVLVVALPAVEAPQFPPLRPVDAKEIHCARKDALVLPVEGAPLMFSTAYAHDMMLRVHAGDGGALELPAHADAVRGGLVVDTSALAAAHASGSMSGTLHGYWGFDKYDGPDFQLVSARALAFRLAPGEEAALIVGRQDTVHIQAPTVSCVSQVALRAASGRVQPLEWKRTKADEIEVQLPLQQTAPGELTLLVTQFGETQPQSLALHGFAEAGHLESFLVHAGDATGVLHGSRLDEVETLTVQGVQFTPVALSSTAGHDELAMQARTAQDAGALRQGETERAKVLLKDGRALEVSATIEAPRPSVVLLGKSARHIPTSHPGAIQLASDNELPQDAQLTFALRAKSPASFAHDEKIEVATADGSASTVLGVGAGGMTLQNAKVAVATLDPARAFGGSAFGLLRFRRVSEGVAGDWQPLATLVRLPLLKSIDCPASTADACKLSGANLFLLDSISGDPQFSQPTQVPDGFTGQSLPVQHPTSGHLYVKLRDDPSVVSTVAFDTPPPQHAADAPAPAAPGAPPPTPPAPQALPPPASLPAPQATPPPQMAPAPPTTPVPQAQPSSPATPAPQAQPSRQGEPSPQAQPSSQTTSPPQASPQPSPQAPPPPQASAQALLTPPQPHAAPAT